MTNPQPASLWAYKPWWCQPWSIVLTGVTAVGGMGGLSHNLWLTAATAVLIGLWWFVFLFYVPRLFKAQQLGNSPIDESPAQQ